MLVRHSLARSSRHGSAADGVVWLGVLVTARALVLIRVRRVGLIRTPFPVGLSIVGVFEQIRRVFNVLGGSARMVTSALLCGRSNRRMRRCSFPTRIWLRTITNPWKVTLWIRSQVLLVVPSPVIRAFDLCAQMYLCFAIFMPLTIVIILVSHLK